MLLQTGPTTDKARLWLQPEKDLSKQKRSFLAAPPVKKRG
jgi:hypothetical protein